ncbi:YbhB/YbcL family Raf kinase inhibitor-like protein [Aspergillus candidus]|uniref:PEBP-like protein n=1 Tax=Aspergillus candidus TaxID=41067 RepID=A0A2I2FDZ9_ASPCN|nr:PEBP-like protein [Aspergillus candidus]PLB38861.1 PEBP-like protein [Aspergillus candidus]
MFFLFIYLQYFLGRLLYRIRGHDNRLIDKSLAFLYLPQPNMILEAPECGINGSAMLALHTCLAEDGIGRFPKLCWSSPPVDVPVKEYILLCEDPDPPIPSMVINHGLFYGIPPSTNMALHSDVQPDGDTKDRMTISGWRYVPNIMKKPYIGPAPPLGHGTHRYVFTIIALCEALEFNHADQVKQKQIRDSIMGKVIGWGQWTGTFARPWP